MRRDSLLLEEAIEAASRSIEIVGSLSVDELADDRLRLDALAGRLDETALAAVDAALDAAH